MAKPTFALRYKADHPIEQVFNDSIVSIGQPLPETELLSVMVWNIFKQQRSNWLSILESYAADSQLMLLQEAQTTPELVRFATSHYLVADQVPAIKLPMHNSGVMTLSAAHPVYCCPLRKAEPLLRLPKSTLITVYPLFDGRLLMVVNIHSINFSIGVDIYQQQLRAVSEQIAMHNGPIIFAGDFNTWSRQRLLMLYSFTRQMRLQEVRFEHDLRKKAFGLPLDFVFYRGLKIAESAVISTHASDHNPLLVKFHMAAA